MDLLVEHVDVWAASIEDQPGGMAKVLTGLSEAGAELGFNVASSVHSLRIEGANEPGLGAVITNKLAGAGINLRGFSAAVLGARFIVYIGFDSAEDAEKAAEILQTA